jgi:AcrR family transcriptional regulator
MRTTNMTAPAKDTKVIAALIESFRTWGYEGTSLKRISEATGLARASLYHRFPDGKAQMAEAVMDVAYQWMDTEALAPLRDETLEPSERIDRMTGLLNDFYEGGEKACLLDALTLGEAGTPLRAAAKSMMDIWIEAMAALAATVGMEAAEALARAEDAVGRVQGSLIVARVQDKPSVFRRALEDLPELLLGPAA